jgi:hypothetical protein
VIARIPESPPLCLADAKPGDLVQVRLIVFELVRSRCWHLPLREGDTVRFVETGDEAVTVSRLDGTHLAVPSECARFIGVERIPVHEDAPTPGVSEAGTGAASPVRPTRWGAR